MGLYSWVMIATDNSDVKPESTFCFLSLCVRILQVALLSVGWILALSFIGPFLGGAWVVIGTALVIGLATIIGTHCVLHPIILWWRRGADQLSDDDRALLRRRLSDGKKDITGP